MPTDLLPVQVLFASYLSAIDRTRGIMSSSTYLR